MLIPLRLWTIFGIREGARPVRRALGVPRSTFFARVTSSFGRRCRLRMGDPSQALRRGARIRPSTRPKEQPIWT